MSQILRKSEDGHYVAKSAGAGFELFMTCRGEEPLSVGFFTSLDSFDIAVDTAAEEARCLLADAREEFGL